jgi:hypothetical protein
MTYLIDYILHYPTGHKSHTVKVKNCQNEDHARWKFEQNAPKVYPVKASIVRVYQDVPDFLTNLFK